MAPWRQACAAGCVRCRWGTVAGGSHVNAASSARSPSASAHCGARRHAALALLLHAGAGLLFFAARPAGCARGARLREKVEPTGNAPAARNRARAASAHLPPAAARPPQDRATTVLNFGGRSDVFFLGIFDGTVGDFAGPSDLSGGSARSFLPLSSDAFAAPLSVRAAEVVHSRIAANIAASDVSFLRAGVVRARQVPRRRLATSQRLLPHFRSTSSLRWLPAAAATGTASATPRRRARLRLRCGTAMP